MTLMVAAQHLRDQGAARVKISTSMPRAASRLAVSTM